MERVQIAAAAYSTIILHGAKYPSCPIIGLLIGYEENNTVIFLFVYLYLSISLCHSLCLSIYADLSISALSLPPHL
jgi:hypothetical protein